MPRDQAGFTLVELMVAVAVFIILTVIAVPSFSTYLDKARVRGAADDVVNVLSLARQGAVKLDRNVSILTKPGTGADWCIGAREADDPVVGEQATGNQTCDCATAAGACLVDGRQLVVAAAEHPGITLASAASQLQLDGRLGIRTDADIADADKSSFDLTSKSGKYVLTIKISALGQATVCSKQGNIRGYPSC